MGRHGMVARWAWIGCGAVALVAVLAVSGPVPTGLASQCEIWPRFLVLAEALPDLIGNCVAPESLNGETGDIEQPVDGGVLVLRSADNTPTFTDGWQSWVAGPNGIETRLNSERLGWEPGEASLAVAAVAPDEAAVVPDGGTLLATRPALDVADMYAGVAPSVVKILVSDGTGSGVRVASGIVTNAHVVGDETSVTVVLADGQQVRGQVVKVDQVADLALVTTEGWIPELEIERASLQRVGDAAYVVGFPLPDKSALAGAASLSRGIISGFRNGSPGVAWIQTDAAVNPGNSGGGLFNAQGKLIGIPSWGFKGAEGLNFAISADTVTAFLARPGSRRGAAPTATVVPRVIPTATVVPRVIPTATAVPKVIPTATAVPKAIRVPAWTVVAVKPRRDWRTDGTGTGEFDRPEGIAVDGNGTVWVADTYNNRIQAMGSDGRWRVAGGKAGGGDGAIGSGAGEFSSPAGIAVDGNGVVWVADRGNHRIQAMGSDGRWRVAGARGSGAGEFSSPAGIAVDGNGVVWVVDFGNQRIQAMGSDGRWRVAGGKAGGGDGAIGSGAGEFWYPNGIAVDGNVVVWVADSLNHRIQSMGSDGQWRVYGGRNTGALYITDAAGDFSSPSGIAVDGNGTVWVADTGNHRIQRFGVG